MKDITSKKTYPKARKEHKSISYAKIKKLRISIYKELIIQIKMFMINYIFSAINVTKKTKIKLKMKGK